MRTCISDEVVLCFQESVRKAADLTLKTLSKVKLLASLHVFMVCVHSIQLAIPVCAGVHPHVRVHGLCSPENCGSDAAHPARKGHR